MKTMYFILILFLVATNNNAAEQEPATKPATFYVHAGAIKHRYTCAAGVESDHIDDGVLHANLRRGKDRFLLISYSMESHPNRPLGRCGSGIESYLVWLHVRGSTVLAMESVQYESCWRDIDGGPPKWAGQFCVVEYSRFLYDPDKKEGTELYTKASFDSEAPEKGFKITEEPSKVPK